MADQFSVIGKNEIKVDALEKVLGKTKFAADYSFPNMLYGGVFRSTVPHAYIKKMNLNKAKTVKGVEAVLDYHDIPGENRFGIIIRDEPCLVDDKIRRFGDALAVVAAQTQEALQEALSLIEVEYEEIEAIFTIERARQSDAPIIHGTTNIHQVKHMECGDVKKAFADCDIIIENTYATHRLSHMFIEPDAGIAYYDENGMMTVVASTQNPHYDRNEVARLLGLPYNKVRVVQAATGGGFGGKLDISVQCHCALLTYHTGKPVRIVRTRKESTTVSSKRHPITMTARTGALSDGTLLAMEVDMLGDTGAYASYGPAVITRAMVHCTGPYNIPNVRADATFVYTNNPMAGAFRGFGVPQVAVCHEGQMNALARKLKMDPIEIRLKNAHRVGTKIPTGQVLENSVGFIETLNQAREKAEEVLR